MRNLIFFFLIFYSLQASSQVNAATKIKIYNDQKSNPKLFIHFDKNIYTSNEIIYFTGFLLNISEKDLLKHELLSITLSRNSDSTIVLADKFIVQEGFIFGSLQIPETLRSDDYQIIAYTNLLQNDFPVVSFAQQIKVISTIDAPFVADFKILNDNSIKNNRKILLSVLSDKGSFLPAPASVTYTLGTIKQTTKTDITGQLVINLPVKETAEYITATVRYNHDSVFLKFPLPPVTKFQNVTFYPEGGQLVDKVPSKVAVEARNYAGVPLSITAVVIKNEQTVDTIVTSNSGFGLFSFTPDAESRYKIRLLGVDYNNQEVLLPDILSVGVTISTPESFDQDTISFYLKSRGITKVQLRVHNFRETFIEVPLTIIAGEKKVHIPLADIPRGPITVSIIDPTDSKNVFAERIFYAHYHLGNEVDIASDQSEYKRRQKVTISLRLKDINADGVVSVAVVQEKRLSPFYMTDIKTYKYITHELSLKNISGASISTQENKELLFLMKGWQQNVWERRQNKKIPDSIFEEQLKLSVMVTKGNRPSPAKLTLLGGNSYQLFEVPTAGEAVFDPNRLLAAPGKSTYLIAVGNKDNYKINIKDPFDEMNKKVGKEIQNNSLISNSFADILKNDETVGIDKAIIMLKEVVISKGVILPNMRNECGDWVCSFKVLNCENHAYDATSTKPIKGEMYFQNRSGTKIPYPGCDEIRNDTRIRSPHKEREFYVVSYDNPSEPAVATTIYWNYGLLLNKSNAQEITFYTSDMPGKYKIIVQGIGNEDVVFGEHTFTVK